MTGTKLILAAAAAALALSGAGGLHGPLGADATDRTPSVVGAAGAAVAQEAQAPPSAGGDAARPPATLAQAVRSAERRTNGRAREAELERDDGVYVYEIKTVSKEGAAKVIVDFASGNVDRVDGRGFLGRIVDIFDEESAREQEAMLKALESSPVRLGQAIDAAEGASGGRAVKAEMRDRYGAMFFEVGVIVDGAMRKVEVDAATGKVGAVRAQKDRDGDGRDDDEDD